MRTKDMYTVVSCLLTAMFLAACGEPATTTVVPTAEGSPTSPCPSVGSITVSLSTPQPTDVLLELAWEGGFTPPELAYAFGRVPEFSLLPSSTAYYRDPSEWDQAQVMEIHLPPAETDDLLRRVLDLGLERLESHTDECQPQADGTCLCVADAGQSVLRMRLPGGELREIRNYADFANDPEALGAIRTLLEGYQHSQAYPYVPEKASLFVRPVSLSSDLPVLDWPLSAAWLSAGTPDAACVKVLSGGDLQAVLTVTGRNMGDFTFRAGEQGYAVYLVPWLPGVDYTDLIAGSGQACPDTETTSSRDETVTSPCAPPAADRFAGSYQRVGGLEPGAVYELSITGMMREEAAHPDQAPYRYRAQRAYSSQVHGDWTLVAGWQELPWDEISLRTEPGGFSTYTAHLVAPSQPLTLFIRAWSKWALAGRELDVNLDEITLLRCGPAATAERQTLWNSGGLVRDLPGAPSMRVAAGATAWQGRLCEKEIMA